MADASRYTPAMSTPPSDEVPVTMVISRVAKRGAESDLERWIEGVSQVVGRFEGNRGIQVIRPRDPAEPEYVLLVSFAHWRNLRAWIASREREQWLAKAEPFTESTSAQVLTGMETWFTLPGRHVSRQAPRWKQAVVTFLAIYPLVILLNLALEPALSAAPLPLRTLAMSGLLVPLMTWVVMPNMTRLFWTWLYR